jgi:phosphomannomutase
MAELERRVQSWLRLDPDESTADALRRAWDGDRASVERAFSGRLQFGTAGLRGMYGFGPMGMNRLVIQQTTAGLALWLQRNVAGTARVVIGYDARRLSDVFASDAASVLEAAGIQVFLFESVTTTPCCAFHVLQQGAHAGIMVTASHNPPEYNGFKVYAVNGAQIVSPADTEIAACIEEAAARSSQTGQVAAEPRAGGSVTLMGADATRSYLDAVKHALEFRLAATDEFARADLKIVYTAMHGTGAHQTLALLSETGFDQVTSVASQQKPDGSFPTVRFPNPEEPAALAEALLDCQRVGADILLANDPDADRLAVAVFHDGEWVHLNGDEIGCLLAGDLLAHSIVEQPLVATTIVSSRMLSAIARSWGADFAQTLTGFKWIANAAMDFSARTGRSFLFGYEEAIGFTVGETVRDKDGVSAALAVALVAAKCKDRGLTLVDELDALRAEHGIYLTGQVSFPTTEPLADRWRAQPPTSCGGVAVQHVFDLSAPAAAPYDGLPASDVMILHLADDSRLVLRPSGTEPKVKLYLEVVERADAHDSLDEAMDVARGRLTALKEAARALVG